MGSGLEFPGVLLGIHGMMGEVFFFVWGKAGGLESTFARCPRPALCELRPVGSGCPLQFPSLYLQFLCWYRSAHQKIPTEAAALQMTSSLEAVAAAGTRADLVRKRADLVGVPADAPDWRVLRHRGYPLVESSPSCRVGRKGTQGKAQPFRAHVRFPETCADACKPALQLF